MTCAFQMGNMFLICRRQAMVGVIAFKKRCMIAIKDQPVPYFISASGAV
jgi:hypothetical protein